ncbi:MAG: hypothetical protein RIS90_2631 [Pseudomonadota bacterium]
MSPLTRLLLFLAVVIGTLALLRLALADRAQRRLRDLAPPRSTGTWQTAVVRLLAPLANLSTPDQPDQASRTRRLLLQAGIRSRNAPAVFYGAKTLLPLLAMTLGYGLAQLVNATNDRNTLLLALLLGATVACYLPNLVLWRLRLRRQLDLLDAFPDAADLLLICVESGLGLDSALLRVAEEVKQRSLALAQEIHLTNLEIRAGIGRGLALRNMGERTGLDEVASLAAMLSQAERFGTSVGESLRAYSDDLRQRRQMRTEEASAKVSTKMLFPLVLCIFPAIILVILGPALIRIVRALLPMLGGDTGVP